MPVTLAEIVIAEGLLRPAQLAQVVEAADRTRLPMVVPLVRDHSVDEVALVAAFKKHLRIKTLDPAKVEFDSDALRELALDDCRRLRALPLSVGVYGSGPRILRVAMADPTDTVSFAELEHLSGCHVEPVLVTLSAVEEMIETAYRHFVTEVMKRSDIVQSHGNPPSKPAFVRPATAPHHRLSDEAGAVLRIQALVALLVEKGVCSASEYESSLRALMKSSPSGSAKAKKADRGKP